jgi:hypothetical protein
MDIKPIAIEQIAIGQIAIGEFVWHWKKLSLEQLPRDISLSDKLPSG